MGPPPPPPPPPVLTAPTILPSRKWKTENASGRINNSTSAAPKPTRPTVDAAALQHAAARLRKTGYNESLRSDVASVPDGRLDGADQRLSHRDRPNGAQHEQLQFNASGETLYASPARSGELGAFGDVRRNTAPLNYSTINREASSNFSSNNNNNINSNNNNINNYSNDYKSPYSNKHSYPTNFRSYHKDDDYFDKTLSSKEPLVSNPRQMIHEYSTTNFVREETQPESFEKNRARQFVQNSLARQLRDEGLTETQKAANRFQKSTAGRDNGVPFDVGRIVQDSYNGDEVDHLVHQMKSDLSTRTTNTFDSASPSPQFGIDYNQKISKSSHQPSVVQYPRSRNDSSSPDYSKRTISTNTTTFNRKIMNINVCVGCGKEITADQPGCNAMNQIFHVDCFKCGRCSKTLAGSSFYNIDEKPTCESCYQDTLEKCTACQKSISDKILRACGGTYHVTCFVCVSCKKSLDGVPFTLDKENQVHCVPCFHDKFAPRCAMCSKPIIPVEGEKESVRVVAMDKSFHVDCYKCEDCGLQLSSKLEGHGCYPIDQHLLCKTCNGNRLRVQSSA